MGNAEEGVEILAAQIELNLLLGHLGVVDAEQPLEVGRFHDGRALDGLQFTVAHPSMITIVRTLEFWKKKFHRSL